MAAAIIAIRRRNRQRKPKQQEEEDEEPPEWAKRCWCWVWFWSKTNLDEKFWSKQPAARKYYAKAQPLVAALIMGNFLCNMVEKQIDPASVKFGHIFFPFEAFFNVAFLIELLFNMYAHWFWKFVKSSWNWFDLLVVTLGLLSVANLLSGPLTLLRNLRAFRVFRLFKRVKSLNKILKALVRAVPGVSNAFIVLFLVMSIYAILGVEFFQAIGVNEAHQIVTIDGNLIDSTTARGMTFGEEYFGNFGRALYTLFQVLLGDSWSEICARTILFAEYGYNPALGAIYFVTFMIVNAVILTNVALAVLLEKVIEDPDAAEGADEEEAASAQVEAKRKSKRGNERDSRRDSKLDVPARVVPYAEPEPLDDVGPLAATLLVEDAEVSREENGSPEPPRPKAVSWGQQSGGSGHGVGVQQLASKVAALSEEMGEVRPALRSLQEELAAMRAEQREMLQLLIKAQQGS